MPIKQSRHLSRFLKIIYKWFYFLSFLLCSIVVTARLINAVAIDNLIAISFKTFDTAIAKSPLLVITAKNWTKTIINPSIKNSVKVKVKIFLRVS